MGEGGIKKEKCVSEGAKIQKCAKMAHLAIFLLTGGGQVGAEPEMGGFAPSLDVATGGR